MPLPAIVAAMAAKKLGPKALKGLASRFKKGKKGKGVGTGRRRRKGLTAKQIGNVMLAKQLLGQRSPGMQMVGVRLASKIL